MTEISDADLLSRFVTSRDEVAFAELMARHGSMVFGVCRRLVSHAQDAEDAYQAVFLVLVRKAASIGNRELLGNWLYGVAVRVAARARMQRTKRRTREATDLAQVAEIVREPAEATDLSAAIAEEVQRLPAKYRGPVVLYYLEGRTNDEVAGDFHCPIGTIKTRLSRAREMLRKRLLRRGLALSTAAFSTALLAQASAASLPPVLIDSTLKAAMSFVAGDAAAGGLISAQAAKLTKGVLHTMFVTRMKMLAALVLALAAVVGGVGGLTYHLLAKEAEKKMDKDAIQGTWKVVGVEANGKDVSGEKGEPKLFASSMWTISADKVVMTSGDTVVELKYVLDSGKTPKVLDCTVEKTTVPRGEGGSWRAVYSLEGDTLKICVQFDPEAERPAEVGTKEGSKTMLIVLKRAKK